MERTVRSRIRAMVVGAAVAATVAGSSNSPAPSPSATPAPTVHIVHVEIVVPTDFATIQVVRGSVLALHLRLKSGTPTSAWNAEGTYSGPGQDFVVVQVPYPGKHPQASASDLSVAYGIGALGTTHLGLVIPTTFREGAPCPPPAELITVRATKAG